MTTTIDYALMAGASYISNRDTKNRFPIPQGWGKLMNPDSYFRNPSSGFEAISFTNGTEIVISFAGTDFSSKTSDFVHGNIPLALGNLSDQLRHAADYYLLIKALNPGATITMTGHSLGGGLASLLAVFFDETAVAFDEAPFRASAEGHLATDSNGFGVTVSAAQDLRAYLTGSVPEAMLAKLDAYIVALDIFNSNKVTADTLAGRETKVTNLNVQGEILSTAPVTAFDRIGTQADANNIGNSGTGVSGGDLHSQALLVAFLQRGDQTTTTASEKTLGQATFKLPDLLKMIFDGKLFYNDPLNITANAKENFLERLVKHQATVVDQATGATDAMVTRFTTDLWKLAQDGGLTRADGNPTSRQQNFVSKALMAFAMQMYYEDTTNATNPSKQLFTEATGGIQFDMADVSKTFVTALQNGEKLKLSDAKGFELYFQHYLAQSSFTAGERRLMVFLLPYMRDWYVQAGADGLAYTDILNRGAFMLGGVGSDALVGGSAADLLVGNAGDDVLMGGAGNDTLLGGVGDDTYVFQSGDGLDTILDSDASAPATIATYKARMKLDQQVLSDPQGRALTITSGMQVVAEINQGKRTVLEYLLSPVQKVSTEAGRER